MTEQEKLDEILDHLDSLRTADRLEYNDYSDLHDMVSRLTDNLADGDRAVSLNAINNLQKYRYNCGEMSMTVVSLASVNELPPVTSKDVPDNNVGKCEDAISRREAIKIFTYNYKGERIPDYDCDNFPVQIAMKKVKKMLRELPPVKPQEQTGKWIKMPLIETGQKFSHKCSLCGRGILALNVGLSEFPYCHCGARMEGEQNG